MWTEGEDYMVTGASESGSYTPLEVTIVPLKENPGTESRTLTVEFDTDGDGQYDLRGTIIQSGDNQQSDIKITDVTEVSKGASGGKYVVTYQLTGENLNEETTEIKVKQGIYAAEEWLYDVQISGSGETQTVIVTFTPDMFEAKYTVSFSAAGAAGESKEMTVTVPKEGELGEETGSQSLTGVTASKTEITNTNRTVVFTLTGAGLTEKTGVKIVNQFSSPIEAEKVEVNGTGNSQTVAITFPENEFEATYTITFYANGDTDDIFTEGNCVTAKIQHSPAGDTEKEPEITKVEPVEQTVTNANRKVTFTLTGTDLTEDTEIEVQKGFSFITDQITDIQILGSGTSQTVTMTMPENTKDEDQEYTVSFYPSEQSTWDKVKTAAVTVQKDSIAVGEAQVTSITPVPAAIGSNGGMVELKVSGNELTAGNWGVKVTAYLEGMMEWPSLQPAVIEIREDGASLQIPANTMRNQIEYRITAGAKNGDDILEQANAVVTQAPKANSVSLAPRAVELSDEHTVTVTFPEEVFPAETDETTLKEKIFIADYGTEENKRVLAEDDAVTVKGSQVVIKTKEPIELNSLSALYMKEGALKNADGALIQDISWLITAQPRVSKIALDREILDSAGGQVTARLNGSRLDELKEGSIEGKILVAGKSSETAIPVNITYGTEPELTFDLPENTTDQTQSYLLKVTVNGSPVIEGISGNPAERAVVSVLPEGKKLTDQTLSSMTISGKAEAGTDGDLTDIALTVSQSAGELKAVLHLYGTNLDSSITELKAIDENGIEWPVYHIAECDGTFRFTAIAYEHGNGATGDGNSQIIEILPPRYAGTNKTYKIYAAIDGKNFLEEPVVTLTVNNEAVSGEADFTPCGPEDVREVVVKYVEQGTGKELASADVYKGYSISMVQGFHIAPKTIEGYQLVTSPKIDLDNDFVLDGREYTYEYKKLHSGEQPEGGEQKPGGEEGGQGQEQESGSSTETAAAEPAGKTEIVEKDGDSEGSPKTGDVNQVLPWMAGIAGALAVIAKGRKRAK